MSNAVHRTPPAKLRTRAIRDNVVQKMMRELLESPIIAAASAKPVSLAHCGFSTVHSHTLCVLFVHSCVCQWVFMFGPKTEEMAQQALNMLLDDKNNHTFKCENRNTLPGYLKAIHFYLIGGNHSTTAKKRALEIRPSEENFQFQDCEIFINLDQSEMEKVGHSLYCCSSE